MMRLGPPRPCTFPAAASSALESMAEALTLMTEHRVLQRILALDPELDHLEIYRLMVTHEFPFDTTRALEFALYRTYAVPSIAALLDRTGEFARRAQKRYDDTDLILSEIAEYGYDSARGQAALAQMNRIHARFAIANVDFLYVLSTLIYEPIRWNARFGWRRMVPQERLAAYSFWCEVGRRMGITNIPESYAAFEDYNVRYEREHFRFTPASRRVASATRDMFLSWFLPRPLWLLGRPIIYGLLDPPLLEAFGFPNPPKSLRSALDWSLRTRGRLARLLPERRRPHMRTEMRHRSYPDGYRIAELGPPAPGPVATRDSGE
jgi:hypothetical protein